MNIIIDIRCLNQKHRTGVGEYSYELLDTLFKTDSTHQYFLFYNSFKDISDNIPNWSYENVHYVVTRWSSKLLNILMLLHIIKLDNFIKKRIDKKNTYHNMTIDYFFAPNINFINLSKQTKLVLTVHDLSFEFFPEFFSWKQRIWHKLIKPKTLCKKAHHIMTPSKSTKHDIMMEYDIHGDQVSCVYPGLASDFVHTKNVDTKVVKKKYQLPGSYILYLGTLEPRKNIHVILDAYERLSTRDRRMPLVIAGGRGWQYHDIISRIDHMANVYYIGYVDRQDKIALYDMARMFIFPSMYEGFGFPVLEAMSRGIPVITTSRSSLLEVIGEGAISIKSHDVSALSRSMHHILNNHQICDIMSDISSQRSAQFRWQRAVEEFLLLLEK